MPIIGPGSRPVFTGQVGLGVSQLGSMQLGGPGPYVPPAALPILGAAAGSIAPVPNAGYGYLARLYSNRMTFKKSLGPLLNKPILKWSLNAGHHPIQVDLPVNDVTIYGPQQGDIVRLTEQGGDGKIIYTGILSNILSNIDARPPYISLMIDPLVTELGEAPFNHDYLIPTDIAQMVRDAVHNTAHLSYTPQSIPDAGIFAVYNFSLTNSLEVLGLCKHIGGPHFWFHVDELGVVWFQAAPNLGGPSTALIRPAFTIGLGANYSIRKRSAPLSNVKNYIVGVGHMTVEGPLPIISIYSNQVSQDRYGLRFLTPILSYPSLTDQGTLDRIIAGAGAALDRIQNTITMTLPNYGSRFKLGRFGGPTIRYWEPDIQPLGNPNLLNNIGIAPRGGYSPNYIVLDVEMEGPEQRLILGDLPISADDFKFEIERNLARIEQILLLNPPIQTDVRAVFAATGQLAST